MYDDDESKLIRGIFIGLLVETLGIIVGLLAWHVIIWGLQ
jgi:hypothetical protein